MKRDKGLPKLKLNKQTLRALNSADLAAARGGALPVSGPTQLRTGNCRTSAP